MNTTRDDHEHRSGTGPRQRPAAPARVRAALAELGEQTTAVGAMPITSSAERAERDARLAMIAARTAGWWGVLANHVYADHDTDTVYGRAALTARAQELDRARFWREHARTWQAHAEQDHAEQDQRRTERDAESVTAAPVTAAGTADVADVAVEVDQ